MLFSQQLSSTYVIDKLSQMFPPDYLQYDVHTVEVLDQTRGVETSPQS
jgi:hypothetical protein